MTLENSLQRGFRHGRGRLRNGQRSPVGRLIVGSVIAIWGCGLLLDNLGFGDMRLYVHRAWPALLVIVGITLLIHRDASNRHGFWGTAWILAGVWVYAAQHDWIHASLALLGPMLLVLLGASFIYRAFQQPAQQPGAQRREKCDHLEDDYA